ncbi:MAG: DNA ligase D [Bacteroidota bacterium]
MLAKETDTPFDDKDWIFEIKWDGYRAISDIKNGVVELYSRNGISFNDSYPVVYNELKKLKQEAVLDGEIVIINEAGKSDFQKLQHYEDNTQYPIQYYVFDLLKLNGQDTSGLPLTDRKALLKKIIPKNAVIKYSEHVLAKGIGFFNAARDNDLEGIMAKKADSEYHTGARTGEWLKIKHHKSDEVVIVGFTESTGSRSYFGALVLAVKTEDGLKYAGHTGSGFTDSMLKEVYGKLKPLTTKQSPFNEVVKTNMPVTWVKPKYVCEIKFTEWTNDGKMRHPIFLRMREDKTIKDVVMSKVKAPAKKTAKEAGATRENEAELVIGKTKVKLTNRNKIYFPEDKITKGMVVDYYQEMSDYILPYLKDRPESLKRNPGGIHEEGFYHKDAGEEAPPFVKSFSVFSESSKKDIDYIICNDKATLAYLNNLGCIEINPWNSTTKYPDKPDYMIIDIDPSEKNNFEQVIEASVAFKSLLDKAGAACFCKTSGATGLHIYVPMAHKYPYEQVKDFANFLCMLVNEQLPDFTTLERNLKKRGNKHIYLDYLQNRRGQTIACAYSLRPHIGATVSTPLEWKEVKPGLHPSSFTIHTIGARVKKLGDIFKAVLGPGVDIKKCLDKLS